MTAAQTERLTLTGTRSRATNLLTLRLEFRAGGEQRAEEQANLPAAELENTLARLRTEGWQIESQCANPTAEAFIDIYTFTRPAPST